MRGILAFVAASAACAIGANAQAPAADPAPIPRYEVEVIVFAHRDFDPSEERFDQTLNGLGDGASVLRETPVFDASTFAPPDAPAAAPPGVFEPLQEVDPVAAERAEALRVRPLAPDELKLGTEFRKIRTIAAYEPLVHVGWVQPGLPENDAVPIDLATFGILNPRGTVRVHLIRYLHVTLDLTYQGKGRAAAASTADDGLDEIVVAPQYRLQAARNVRSNELHYFDHPAFGVLVRITPVPTQDTAGGRRPAA